MGKNILYYPTIEFKQEDYRWLWVSSLLWDRIYRIVPDGYKLHEPRNIQELCSTNEIGIPLSPNKYSKEISNDFLEKIENREWSAAALEFNHDDIDAYDKYCRIHKDKIDVSLQNILLINKDISEDESWLYVPKEMSNIYMAYLAKHMASENKLALSTHSESIWTASTFFLHDEQIQDGFYSGKAYSEPSEEALASLLIKDMIPENILDITPTEVLKFREQRKDERSQFIQAIDAFGDKLSSVRDDRILKEIIREERTKVEYALKDYKKSMDILKVAKWTGYLTSLITIATDALGYIDFNSNTIRALTSTGIGIGIITGLVQGKNNKNETPYSYLTHMKSIFPNEFNNYNYRLYRNIEEFIND